MNPVGRATPDLVNEAVVEPQLVQDGGLSHVVLEVIALLLGVVVELLRAVSTLTLEQGHTQKYPFLP